MRVMQGRVPVRVMQLLLVNPPSWFNSVWKTMQTMICQEFEYKVHVVTESDLADYLAPGYENNLPDEFETGRLATDVLVNDFVAYRLHAEAGKEWSDDTKSCKSQTRRESDESSVVSQRSCQSTNSRMHVARAFSSMERLMNRQISFRKRDLVSRRPVVRESNY
jgi:CRAL/TRIO domain